MSKLISGKEALIALANGEELEFQDVTATWHKVHKGLTIDCFDRYKFRLKPRTIKINGIEVPAPFEPEYEEEYWHISHTVSCGYDYDFHDSESRIEQYGQFGAWRTEEEIKQVVAALRSIFNNNSQS